MATVTPDLQRGGGPGGEGSNVLRLGKPFRYTVLILVGAFFIIPIVASARFSFLGNNNSFSFAAYTQLFGTAQFWSTLWLSVKVGVGTVALTLVLLIPTVIFVHVRLPRLRRLFESVSLLPLVIPSVVVTLGVITSFRNLPNIIYGTPVILALEYVVLALPYSYRTFDSAVQSIDLKTLVDAGQSLGAGWIKLLRFAILPNVRAGLLGASILTFAFCLGEFAVASLLSFTTFPVFLVQVGRLEASQAVALSLIALIFTWIPLALVMIVFSQRRGARRGAGIESAIEAAVAD